MERIIFLSPLYVQASVPCLLIPILALHKVLVVAWSAQHCLDTLGDNLAMCNLEAKRYISNTDIIWTTSCTAKLNNSSMCRWVAWVLGLGMKLFTLSEQWALQSTLNGTLSSLFDGHKQCTIPGVNVFYPWVRLHDINQYFLDLHIWQLILNFKD